MSRKISLPLADIRQDIAGDIPIELIQKWETSTKTSALHKSLLESYLVDGTVVCSDSSGLSYLSQERPLLEVLSLISTPKQLIYSCLTNIGGQAIGIWTADNSETIFPLSVPHTEIVHALATIQSANANNHVQVGLAAHRGHFYHIGSGLYGPSADLVESLAEDGAGPGDIWLTKRSKPYRYTYEKITHPQISITSDYPHPFDAAFFTLLKKWQPQNTQLSAKIHSLYSSTQTIMFIKISPPATKTILEQLSRGVIASSIVASTIEKNTALRLIKTTGYLGIATTAGPQSAIESSRELVAKLRQYGFKVTIGITKGEVFLFPITQTLTEIAGEPVNLASKLAEDSPYSNHILVHDSTDLTPGSVQPFRITLSHVNLSGYILD